MDNKLALVIEDDSDAAVIFSAALRANGFDPKAVHLGDIASKRLSELSPEIVLLDMHLPKVPGTELIKQIRENERTKDVMVIIVSADPRMAGTVEHLADLVIIKPTTFSQVRDLIARMIRTRAAEKLPESGDNPAEPA